MECEVWSVGCGVIPSDIILDKINDILLGNVLAIHADALAEIHEVRRSVKSHAKAAFAQNTRQSVRNRAFSVGSGHVNRLVAAMRMTVVFIEDFGGLQARLVTASALSFKHRQLAVKKFAGFFIIHFTKKITKNNS